MKRIKVTRVDGVFDILLLKHKTSHNFLKHSAYASPIKLIDFYNKNHFDYRGLIPMGLAIDATNLNVY